MRQEIEIPMELPSLANARHGHWSQRAKRVSRQRSLVTTQMSMECQRPELPVTIALHRVSKLPLDDDNMRGALKGIRDGLADWLLLTSDRDPRVRWVGYGHRKDPLKRTGYQAARIIISPGHEDCPTCGAPTIGGRFQ